MGIMNAIFGNVSEMDAESIQKNTVPCCVKENASKEPTSSSETNGYSLTNV